jgi:hypothetical protein
MTIVKGGCGGGQVGWWSRGLVVVVVLVVKVVKKVQACIFFHFSTRLTHAHAKKEK